MNMCREARGAEGIAGNSSQGAASQRGHGGPLTKHEVTVYVVEKARVHIEMWTY